MHLSEEEYKKYIAAIQEVRNSEKEVPYEYDRTIGNLIKVFVKDDLYKSIKGSLRLLRHELNNLLTLEEITIIWDI